MKSAGFFAAFLFAVVGAVTDVRGQDDVLGASCLLLDGTRITVRSLAITDNRITVAGAPADFTLDDIQRIDLPSDDEYLVSDTDGLPKNVVPTLVELQSGGRLIAKQTSIANEKIKLQWRPGQPLELPLDFVRGLRFDLLSESTEYEKALAAPPAALDRVFIKDEAGTLSSISGLVDFLDIENVTLEVKAQSRSLARSTIYGIVFAQPVPPTSKPRCVVTFREGSQLGGEKLTLTGGHATLSLGNQYEARFAWSDVDHVAIRSSRMAYLSDLTPTKEEQTPIVTLPFPAQRDKSVSGGRLQIGLIERFEKGLGVHARSAITFATDGKWDLFSAKIGIDGEADGKGDCIFQVLADGKSIFQQRKTGQDLAAAEIKLPITNCQQLTLIVEPGEGLDLADHADWCDARLIQNKR